MWSSDRRGVLSLGGALALSACGFAPAYAPGGPASGLQGRVRAADPGDKAGFDLVTRLEERLGPPANAPYALTYSISLQAVVVGVTDALAITRYNLNGFVDWQLLPAAGGPALVAGRVQSFTSWSATGSTVATVTAQDDATRRLMVILADQIVTRLLATDRKSVV